MMISNDPEALSAAAEPMAVSGVEEHATASPVATFSTSDGCESTMAVPGAQGQLSTIASSANTTLPDCSTQQQRFGIFSGLFSGLSGTNVSAPGSEGQSLTRTTEERYRIFVKAGDVKSTCDHFEVPTRALWAPSGKTRLFSTVVRESNVKDLGKLRKSAALVVPEKYWPSRDEIGAVDFWPRRVNVKKGEWVTHPTWKDKGIVDILHALRTEMGDVRYGAAMYYGKLALRVIVPKGSYCRVNEIANRLHLQMERVGASPVSVARMTVRVLSGSSDQLSVYLDDAASIIEAKYPGVEWGRQVWDIGSVSVLAFIPSDLNYSDHINEMENGVRLSFTPSFDDSRGPSECEKHAKKVAEAFIPTQEEDSSEDSAPDISDDQDFDMCARKQEKALLKEGLVAEKAALLKSTKSWGVLRLPDEITLAAIDLIAKVRVVDDLDAVEARVGWLNTCPTPAQVLERLANATPPEILLPLQTALCGTATPPSAKALATLPQAAFDGGKLSKSRTSGQNTTYSNVAARSAAKGK